LRRERLRIVVAGMVAGVPHHGGATWAVLQWVLGLRRLGHDVLLVEPVDRPRPHQVAYLDAVARRFALGGRAALLTEGRRAGGLDYADVVGFADDADLLVNLAGTLRDQEVAGRPQVRAYVDLDPAFTQLWQADGIDMGFAGHSHFVTVGLEIGRAGCPVPTCGGRWITTLPPVALEEWPVVEPPDGAPWTTVASWRGYGSVVHDGVHHGQKAHAWRELLPLPSLVAAPLRPALAIHPDEEKDVAALEEHGWRWDDPLAVVGSPDDYQAFVQRSAGELGIAKQGYVVSRCGWFSDRSACYLAAGRPVVAQDTGWSAHLPAGEGLLPFGTAEEAAVAVERATADAGAHRRAARAVAEQHLAADVVLPSVLDALSRPT
jgi:hypothetical protein